MWTTELQPWMFLVSEGLVTQLSLNYESAMLHLCDQIQRMTTHEAGKICLAPSFRGNSDHHDGMGVRRGEQGCEAPPMVALGL